MRILASPPLELPERDSLGSSSLSGFEEDLGDLGLILRRELGHHSVRSNLLLKDQNEEAFEEYHKR